MGQRKPTVGLIFSGAGSAGVGAAQAGFEVKYLIDPRDWIIPATWERNFPGVPTSRSPDLADFQDIPVDLIVGSPPCSKYSLLNRTQSRLDLYSTDPNKVEYVAFIREVKKRQPTFFILENLLRIRDFLWFPHSHEDPTLMVHFYDKSTEQMQTKPILRLDGYRVFQYVLDTINSGLAQIRKRLFIIGIKEGLPWRFTPPSLSEPVWFNQAVKGLTEESPNHQKDWLEPELKKKWKKLIYGKRLEGKSKKVQPKGPTPTIIGAGVRHFHYKEPRWLTPRECCRLQGFPDDFKLEGSTIQQLNQIGRAIPPTIIQTLAKHMTVSLQFAIEKNNIDRLLWGRDGKEGSK